LIVSAPVNGYRLSNDLEFLDDPGVGYGPGGKKAKQGARSFGIAATPNVVLETAKISPLGAKIKSPVLATQYGDAGVPLVSQDLKLIGTHLAVVAYAF
jgi:hypothetical protein